MYKKIIAVVVFLSSVAFSQVIGPKAAIPQIDYDFANVPKGETMSHTYIIYNGGDAVLSLSDIRTSCKCITASLDKTHLAPADSARLKVEYTNTGNSKNLDRYVAVKTNDPANPDLRIYVTRVTPGQGPTLTKMPGNTSTPSIKGPSIYFPEATHNFGIMKQGSIGDYVFKFINRGDSTLIIRDIKTSCGCTAALVKNREIDPGKDGQLRVQFDSSGKIGKLSRRISVFTNDPKHIEQLLIIYADVVKETK